MGQIIGSAAKPKRCNVQSLSSLGTPAAGEYILVSSDNSMNAAGQGNFDCYIEGNGSTAATALTLHYFNDEEPVAGSTKGIMSAWAHEYVNPLIDGFLDEETSTEDVSDVKDSVISSKYIASNGRIYGTDATFAIYVKHILEDTTFNYAINGGNLGIVMSDVEIGTGTNEVLAYGTGTTGTFTVPAGKWLGWSERTDGQGSVTLEKVTSYVVPKSFASQQYVDGKVADVEEELEEKTTIDAVSVYDDVIADRCIYATNGKTGALASYEIRYKHITEDTTFKYNVQRANQVIAKSIAEPTTATIFTIIAAPPKTGEFTILAGEWLAWVVYTGTSYISGLWLEKVISVPRAEIQAKELKEATDYERLKDTKSNLLIDGTMCLMWPRNSYNTIMDVVSATADTISVSSTDAANFDSTSGEVAVKHSDGTYTIHLFKIASNVLTIVRRKGYDDNADMSDVVQCQGAYDTPNANMGQHLSAFGCLGYANYIVSEMHKRRTLQQDNLISGYFFTQQGLNNDYNSGLLYDANGNFIYAPRYNDCSFTSPYSGGVKVFNNYENRFDHYLRNYVFRQQAGASVEFDFPSKTYGMGYIEIVGCSEIVDTWVGGWQVDVLEDGVVVATQTMPVEATGKLIFDNINIGKNVSVKFTSDGEGSLNLINMGLYAAPQEQTAVPTLKSTDKIAIIGDSWTQFPAPQSILIPDFSYNTIDTLANGRTADGYCYLPKEMARLTGCQVDNYGYGGQTAAYGLTQIAQEILATGKHYDYIFFEFYINDAYQDLFSKEQWLDNITQFVKMCKSLNARPIVISPTATNSGNQAVGLLNRFQYMKETMFRL